MSTMSLLQSKGLPYRHDKRATNELIAGAHLFTGPLRPSLSTRRLLPPDTLVHTTHTSSVLPATKI